LPKRPRRKKQNEGSQIPDGLFSVPFVQNAGVIVVTHDHRALDVFDRTFEMEDGVLRAADYENSWGTVVVKRICGALVLLGGV
jgi:putative ABC transport system ATP-binding protein